MERVDDVLLVLLGEAGRNGQQEGALEQAVGNRAGAFAIVRAGVLIFGQRPGRVPFVSAGFMHQAGNVRVDVKSPLGHDDVVDAFGASVTIPSARKARLILLHVFPMSGT